MSKLTKILAAISGLLLLTYAIGFALPQTVHVERSLVMDAPAEAVFAEISDFRNWDAWSPWAELDPDAELTITGAEVGQTMVWVSETPQVGRGSQIITAISGQKTALLGEFVKLSR